MMRVVVKHTEERVKYISHLDLMRTMQRAVRWADIPIAYSQALTSSRYELCVTCLSAHQ